MSSRTKRPRTPPIWRRRNFCVLLCVSISALSACRTSALQTNQGYRRDASASHVEVRPARRRLQLGSREGAVSAASPSPAPAAGGPDARNDNVTNGWWNDGYWRGGDYVCTLCEETNETRRYYGYGSGCRASGSADGIDEQAEAYAKQMLAMGGGLQVTSIPLDAFPGNCPRFTRSELASRVIAALNQAGFTRTAALLNSTNILAKLRGPSTFLAPANSAYHPARLPPAVRQVLFKSPPRTKRLLVRRLLRYNTLRQYQSYHDMLTLINTQYDTYLNVSFSDSEASGAGASRMSLKLESQAYCRRRQQNLAFFTIPRSQRTTIITRPDMFCNNLIRIHGTNSLMVPPWFTPASKPPPPSKSSPPPSLSSPPPSPPPSSPSPPSPPPPSAPPPSSLPLSPLQIPRPVGTSDSPPMQGGEPLQAGSPPILETPTSSGSEGSESGSAMPVGSSAPVGASTAPVGAPTASLGASTAPSGASTSSVGASPAPVGAPTTMEGVGGGAPSVTAMGSASSTQREGSVLVPNNAAASSPELTQTSASGPSSTSTPTTLISSTPTSIIAPIYSGPIGAAFVDPPSAAPELSTEGLADVPGQDPASAEETIQQAPLAA